MPARFTLFAKVKIIPKAVREVAVMCHCSFDYAAKVGFFCHSAKGNAFFFILRWNLLCVGARVRQRHGRCRHRSGWESAVGTARAMPGIIPPLRMVFHAVSRAVRTDAACCMDLCRVLHEVVRHALSTGTACWLCPAAASSFVGMPAATRLAGRAWHSYHLRRSCHALYMLCQML